MKLAHIINVTEINESKKASYLHIAQPLTLRSMVIAKKMAKNVIDVDLLAVKHKSEKVSVPVEFEWAPDIDKYAWEYLDALKDEASHKPLPRLKDIVSSLYSSSDAEYFIYTNLDIGLYPHFYIKVKSMIAKGYDAFCINRRSLPKEHEGLLLNESKIEFIFTMEGIKHPGIDCFVFKKELVPLLNLGNVYIGYPPVGQVLKTQIEVNSKSFTWIKDERLTFHIGDDSPWKSGGIYTKENIYQAREIYTSCFKPSIYGKIKEKSNSLLESLIFQTIDKKMATVAKFLDIPQRAMNMLINREAFVTPITKEDRIASLIHKLFPVVSKGKELIRFGPKGDGGYLVPDDLAGIEACFSVGVGSTSGFEKDCANRGMKVFLADKSVEKPAEFDEEFHFTKKYVGATTNEDYITIDNWVSSSLSETQSDLLLQMDIEGYEYEVFLNMSNSLMHRFRIIVVEFHNLDKFWIQSFFKLASRAFDKLLQTHSCVHIHPNNCRGSIQRKELDIPQVAEFTFLRNDRISNPSFVGTFPHPLDYNNTSKPSLPLPKCWYTNKKIEDE